ncbi:MAG: hypothetical protein RL069_852, partial [Planctomycetota bacterium]
MDQPLHDHFALQTRRAFLNGAGLSLGAVALADIQGKLKGSEQDRFLSPKQPHFPGKAKRVIYLHMTGSPPNLDLYDY